MPGSWVQQTAYGLFTYVLRQLTGEWSNLLWEWFSRAFSAPVAVLEDPLVHKIAAVSTGIAMGLLPVVLVWNAFRETLQRLDGAGTVPPEALIRKGLVAGAAVTSTSTVAWLLVTLTDHAREVVTSIGLDVNLFNAFFRLPMEPTVTITLLVLGFLLGVLVLVVQRLVVAAEFTVLLMVGPLMAVGLVRDSGHNTWSVWVRELVSLLITPLVQLLLMVIFAKKWASAGLLDVGDRCAALAFLYLLWNTPRWARQLVYSVGTAGRLADAGTNVARFMVIQQMARRMLRV